MEGDKGRKMQAKIEKIRSYFSDTYFENGAVSVVAHHSGTTP